MNIRFRKWTSSELFFILFFEVGTIANTYGIVGENRILRVFLLISGMLCLIKLMKESYSKNQLFILIGLLLVSAGIYLKASELSPFVTIVVLFVCQDIKFDWLVDMTLYTKITLIIVRLFMISVGLIPNEGVPFWRNGGFILRYKFGYASLNTMQMQIVVVTILLIYKLHKSLHTGKFITKGTFVFIHICFLAVNYFFYRYTISRTSFLVSLMLIIISLVVKGRFYSDKFCKIAPFIMPCWMLFSFVGMVLVERVPGVKFLDSLFSGRFMYGNLMLKMFGLSLFGANVTSTNIIYDNSYTRILINLGLLYSLFIFASMYKITKTASKEKNIGLVLMLIGYQSLAFAESIYGYVFANLTLVLIKSLLYKNRRGENVEKNSYDIYADIQQGRHITGPV